MNILSVVKSLLYRCLTLALSGKKPRDLINKKYKSHLLVYHWREMFNIQPRKIKFPLFTGSRRNLSIRAVVITLYEQQHLSF